MAGAALPCQQSNFCDYKDTFRPSGAFWTMCTRSDESIPHRAILLRQSSGPNGLPMGKRSTGAPDNRDLSGRLFGRHYNAEIAIPAPAEGLARRFSHVTAVFAVSTRDLYPRAQPRVLRFHATCWPQPLPNCARFARISETFNRLSELPAAAKAQRKSMGIAAGDKEANG